MVGWSVGRLVGLQPKKGNFTPDSYVENLQETEKADEVTEQPELVCCGESVV